jgi:hypothetical protein
MLVALALPALADPALPPPPPPTYAFTEEVPITPKPPAPGQAIVLLRQDLHGRFAAQLEARIDADIEKMADQAVR